MVTPAPSATQTPAAPRWREHLQALQGPLPPDLGSRRRGWRRSGPVVSVQPAPTPAVPLFALTLCPPLSLIPRSHVVLHPMAPPRGHPLSPAAPPCPPAPVVRPVDSVRLRLGPGVGVTRCLRPRPPVPRAAQRVQCSADTWARSSCLGRFLHSLGLRRRKNLEFKWSCLALAPLWGQSLPQGFPYPYRVPTYIGKVFSLLSNQPQGKVKVKSLSCVPLFVTPGTVAHQAPQSMEFSRQESWSGLPRGPTSNYARNL